MSHKFNNEKKPSVKKNSIWNAAMNLFIGGCLAELYLLLIRQKYIYGTLDEVVVWDGYLVNLTYVGLAIAAVGLVAALCFLRKPGWKRTLSIFVLSCGLFMALSSFLAKRYYSTAVGPLCFLVPAVMLLGILWVLYDRECSWALTVLAADEVVLWLCRKGLHTDLWRSKVLICAVLMIAVAVAAAILFRQADQKGGMLGKLRLMPEDGDPLPVYTACALSVVSLVLALLSTTIAYYAMWIVAVVIFALAVYYTVRQL